MLRKFPISNFWPILFGSAILFTNYSTLTNAGVSRKMTVHDLYSGYDTDGDSSSLMDNDYIRDAMKTSYGQRKVPFPIPSRPTEPK